MEDDGHTVAGRIRPNFRLRRKLKLRAGNMGSALQCCARWRGWLVLEFWVGIRVILRGLCYVFADNHQGQREQVDYWVQRGGRQTGAVLRRGDFDV